MRGLSYRSILAAQAVSISLSSCSLVIFLMAWRSFFVKRNNHSMRLETTHIKQTLNSSRWINSYLIGLGVGGGPLPFSYHSRVFSHSRPFMKNNYPFTRGRGLIVTNHLPISSSRSRRCSSKCIALAVNFLPIS